MHRFIKDRKNTATFEKPKTIPTSIKPDTTSLSPYLRFGCLSVKVFYKELMDIYKEYPNHSQPPTSLEG